MTAYTDAHREHSARLITALGRSLYPEDDGYLAGVLVAVATALLLADGESPADARAALLAAIDGRLAKETAAQKAVPT